MIRLLVASGIDGLAAVAAAAIAAAAAGEVPISLEQFGAGHAFRPGDWTAIRVGIGPPAGEPRPVRIEWELPDAEGDTAVSVRTVVLTPGRSASRWLYGRLPPASNAAAVAMQAFTIRVFEDRDGARGEELASAQLAPDAALSPPMAAELDEGLFGLIAPPGSGSLGLEGYGTPPPGFTFVPSMNERVRIAEGISVRELPDRWEGWWSYDLLVWAGQDALHRPDRVGLDEGRALRQWIERGGRLVIVLPESGDPWLPEATASPRRHFLADLLPSTGVRRHPAVPVEAILPALSKSRSLRDPEATIPIRTFDPESLPPAWHPAIAFPKSEAAGAAGVSGGIFAVRRRVDFGEVILLGIDLDSLRRRGLQAGGLPEADCLWNPLLGRRGDTLSPREYAMLDDADPRRLLRREGNLDDLGGGALVADRIGLTGRAALGLLSAIGIFGAYWLLAGPLGFALLRNARRERFAWLAFVLVGIAFTAAAWAGGSVLRQSRTRIVHVSVVDRVGVARPDDAAAAEPRQLERVESWFTVAVPDYGTAVLSLPEAADASTRNLLSSWMAPPGDRRGRYPDTARYELPDDRSGSLEIPARATASTFAASWLGTLPPAFGEWPRPLPGHPVEVLTDPASPEPTVLLRGRLQHALAGTLTDVRIIHVNPYRAPLPRFDEGILPVVSSPGELASCGRFVIVPEWPAGEVLDLARLLYPDGPLPAREKPPLDLASQLRLRYRDPLVSRGTFGDRTAAAEDPLRAFDMLSLASVLTPPNYLQNPPAPSEPLRVRRTLGRRLDLGPWLSQPCLVVIGYLRDAAMPAAPSIDGVVPPSDGLTVVRWILPLPAVAGALPPPGPDEAEGTGVAWR
jgi:hypothetical protein